MDNRQNKHLTKKKDWEEKKNKAREQLTGHQAKGGSVEKKGFAQGIKGV